MVRGTGRDVDIVLQSRRSRQKVDKFFKGYEVNTKWLFMTDIASGLEFMHSKQVAHYGMKPANVLVDQNKFSNFFCAITDIGIPQVFSENAKNSKLLI